MKLHVIADAEGNILATARAGYKGDGSPKSFGLIAGAGQMVHQIEVPDQIGELEAALLHWRYKVEVRPSVSRLVELAQPIAEP